jgi:conjugal transfer pilus assembly protein TraD
VRGRIVIIIDPKGDNALYACVKHFCKQCGREFHEFQVAHPEQADALDLLSNFKEVPELASRIAQVLPASDKSAPFIDMGRNVVEAIAVGMAILGEKPTLEKLFKNWVNRFAFGERVLASWLTAQGVSQDQLPLSGKTAQDRVENLAELCLSRSPTPEVVGLISFLRTSGEMLDKTTTSVRNVLSEMAKGQIGRLLSPSGDCKKTVVDARMLIDRGCVFYLGSDSLSKPSLGRLLCALFLADLAAVAGDIYNFSEQEKRQLPEITLFIDEASEVACGPLQDLLSKGRGAGFSIMVATQSVNDFIARLGSEAETARVVANTMNHIVMRNSDKATLEHVTESVPQVALPQKSWSRAEASDGQGLMAQSSQTAERMTKQAEQPIIAKELISALPPGEAFAIVAGNYIEKVATPLLKLEAENEK